MGLSLRNIYYPNLWNAAYNNNKNTIQPQSYGYYSYFHAKFNDGSNNTSNNASEMNFTQISSGLNHSVCLTDDNRVWIWGKYTNANNDRQDTMIPRPVHFTQISSRGISNTVATSLAVSVAAGGCSWHCDCLY